MVYISYVRHFWSRGPRATRKRKPAHLKFKGHMHAYVANASRAITTLIERLHMYSSSLIGASVSEPHLGSSTRPLSVCQSVSLSVCLYIYISCVRHFWSRGPRATRKRKPAHLKFKGHMHACCILLYVATPAGPSLHCTLIERLHMYSSSLITSSAG